MESVSSEICNAKSRNNEDSGEVHLKWKSEYKIMASVGQNEIESIFLTWLLLLSIQPVLQCPPTFFSFVRSFHFKSKAFLITNCRREMFFSFLDYIGNIPIIYINVYYITGVVKNK